MIIPKQQQRYQKYDFMPIAMKTNELPNNWHLKIHKLKKYWKKYWKSIGKIILLRKKL